MKKQLDPTAVVLRLVTDVWTHGDASLVPRFVAARYRIHRDPGDAWEGDNHNFGEKMMLLK